MVNLFRLWKQILRDKTMEALSRFSKIYSILKSGLVGIENLVPINFNNALMSLA
jgi:hypothetical protein